MDAICPFGSTLLFRSCDSGTISFTHSAEGAQPGMDQILHRGGRVDPGSVRVGGSRIAAGLRCAPDAAWTKAGYERPLQNPGISNSATRPFSAIQRGIF